jgi:NAD(P)-dependent dehydrogenase (short-subunit alcohol dehydrogenase family)
MVDQKFLNKTILITGSKGISYDLAIKITLNGGKIIVLDNDLDSLNALRSIIHLTNNTSLFYEVDLKNFKRLNNVIDEINSNVDEIHGFVSYAGITKFSSILDTSEALFDEFIDINLKSAFFLTKFILKKMIHKSTRGSFVFIGSPHYNGGQIDRAPYSVSKGALYTLSEHLSKNYANKRIRSNYLIMGWTLTDGEIKLRKDTGLTFDQTRDMIHNNTPMSEPCDFNSIVSAIIYLLSDDSFSTTGSILNLSGGIKF